LKLEPKHWTVLLITPLSLALDQASKFYVHGRLSLYDEHEIVPGFFNIVYAQNRGLVFGMFQNKIGSFSTLVFGIITVVAFAIIIHLFRQTRKDSLVLPAALGFVLSGALGNLIDRLHWGFVVDFLQLYYRGKYWPTFNVADIAIVIGIVLLVIDSFRAQPAPEAKEASAGQEKKGATGAA
jgi:signal peptidase II